MEEHYVGIDLHCNNNYVVIIDSQDRIVFEKRLANDLPLVLKALSPYRDSIQRVAVESTYNWYWLGDGLKQADYAVDLANTQAIQKYEGLKHLAVPPQAPLPAEAAPEGPPQGRPRNYSWSELMHRVFIQSTNYILRRRNVSSCPDHPSISPPVWAGNRLCRSAAEMGRRPRSIP